MVGYNLAPRGMVNEKSHDHKEWGGNSKESNAEEQRKSQRDPGQPKACRNGRVAQIKSAAPGSRNGVAAASGNQRTYANCKQAGGPVGRGKQY